MFDPMVTPWHALMLLALPAGVALLLMGSENGKTSLIGQACVGCGLPLMLLIVWAIGINHLNALLSFFIGTLLLFMEPSEFKKTLFGDYYGSPIAALAYLGPLAGCSMALVLIKRTFNQRTKAVVLPTFITAALLVSYLEFQSLSLETEISKAFKNLESGQETAASNALETDNARHVLARLSRQGRQFSSAGALYAVGPVDVFGPWTYLQHGRLHPAQLLQQTKFPPYARLYHALWPEQTPQPYSWRGLSPWETASR